MHGSVLCANCGCKRDNHRGGDLACPPVRTWGVPKPEVKYPWKLSNRDEAKADAKFRADLDRYWAKSRTTFEPTQAYHDAQTFLRDLRLGR